MILYPAEVILLIDKILVELYKKMFIEPRLQPNFDKQILSQIFNLHATTRVRDIKPTDINRLISIKGIVIRTSDIYPEMKDASFKCINCGAYESRAIDRGRIDEPVICR